MFEAAEDIGKKNPEWFKAWKDADAIHKALNYKTYLTDVLDEYPRLEKIVTNPLAQAAVGLGAGGFMGGLLGGATGLATTAVARKGTQLYGFLGNKTTEKLLGQALKATVERNIPTLNRIYTQLNKTADKYQQENPSSDNRNRIVRAPH